jgi:translation elongation factor EF-Tu-like GTPase
LCFIYKNMKTIITLLFVVALSPVAAQPLALADSSFYMPVEDVFMVPGRGVAVVGKISTGVVYNGKQVQIKGFSATPTLLTVTSVDKGGVVNARGGPGDLVALIFERGINKEDVYRGMVATDTGFGKNELTADIEIKLVARTAATYQDGDFITLYINAQMIPNCEVILPRGQKLLPGVQRTVKIHFPVYTVVIPNLPIGVFSADRKSIGIGKVIVAGG